ncbi:MAG: sensor histidine kinase [Faecousia sp.]
MRSRKTSFLYKMGHDLTYRLMTAFLVLILPVFIIGGILLGIVWNRTLQQMQSISQSRLEEAMAYWERDCSTLDGAMDYFVSMFLEELNCDRSQVGETAPYRMFAQLEQALVRACHNGLVALRDNHSGRVLAQMQDTSSDALTIDSQVRCFTQRITEECLSDESWLVLDGHHYLVKRFDYRNSSVFFALDVEDSVRERTASIREEKSRIYVTNGDIVLELTEHGAVVSDLTWDQCSKTGFGHTTINWRSESLPIAVCITQKTSLIERFPVECWVLLFLFVLSVFIACMIWRIVRLEVLDPSKKLSDAMHQIQSGNLDYRMHDNHYRNSDDMQYLFDTFDQMADEFQASREKDQKMYQAEMDNLRLQVNPHMLLNSLNTIYSLAQMKKFESIQEYALHLVDYFRYALRRNDNLVSVEQELEVVHTYIEIQKIRYPGAISFVYSIDEDCAEAKVPPLLIQNFIENSVKYAVNPGKVTEIKLIVRRRDDRLEILTMDTGNGMKPEVLEQLRTGEPYVDAMGQKHIGIWNCRRRIEVFFGEEPRVSISSTPSGTRVILNLPFVTEVQP